MNRIAWILPLAVIIVASPAGSAPRQNPAMLRDFSNADPAKKSGDGKVFSTTKGAQTSGRCVEIDANGNHIAAPFSCGGGPLPTTCGGVGGAVDGGAYNNGGRPAICSTTALTWGGAPLTWGGVPITGL